MIEVPVLVKDALRAGNTKKNYRFVVYKTITVDDYEDVCSFDSSNTSFTTALQYSMNKLYLVVYDNCFEGSVMITYPDGGGSEAFLVESVLPIEHERRIAFGSVGFCPIETQIDLYGAFASGSHVDVVYERGNHEEQIVDFTIDNNNLVKESVSIDERMCSESEIKFGLCEGTEMEFQCFGVPNITNQRLQAFIDVQYFDENNEEQWYPIMLGWFTVKECSRQASTGIMKMSCYNKLLSDYLDAKANDYIRTAFSNMDSVYVNDILSELLGKYEIHVDVTTEVAPKTSYSGYREADISGSFKFTSVVGNQGPYGPQNVDSAVTTSTNIYMKADARSWYYTVDPNYPCRVRTSVDFDIIDDNYWNLISNSVDAMLINVSKDTLKTRILNMTSSDLVNGLQGYFFKIKVRFTDGTPEKTFSKVLYEHGLADGTFSDLNKLTFENVDRVLFHQPYMLSALLSGASISVEHGTVMAGGLYGSRRSYKYFDGDVVKTDYYITPKMPDGSDILITYDALTEYISVQNVLSIANNDISMKKLNVKDIADVTLRDLQSAVYEVDAQFGKLDRNTDLFSGIELNGSRLLPADDLYPADNLYPNSMSERSNRSMYSKLWADEGNVRKFRYLIITYKGTEVDPNTQQVSEVEKTLQRTVDEHGTDNYNMSDNWLFKNLVWTDEDVGDYADAMVAKMRGITWFPFEMWCAGLPYIEAGDEVEINMSEGAYTSYVLRRSLKGIQNLQDEMINGTLDIF